MGNSLWVQDSEQFLVEALLKQAEDGDRSENGFKKSAWATVVAELNEAYKDTLEKPFTINTLKKYYYQSLILRLNIVSPS
ncbi:hypothetical protein HOY82DRAFT_610421 [Tuber indicum]|nr:hypothetical protein HOY82DRAFT_610421 [Tuber indicum]